MKVNEKLEHKNRLKEFGLALISRRILASRQSIDEAQDAANQEDKSSAGDKYETGRAMSHLQKEMYARQLEEHRREMAILHAVKTDMLCTTVTAGAFIACGDLGLFVAAGLGKQLVDGNTILFLSPAAPLARQLQNKRKGDTFLFNGHKLQINDIY